ncbi:pectinesterase family protein [Prolixibacter sp. SD074]|uniref:pectinesterase family protein n=1 Tax=Prolixibacter sp. SD074 TaxID=2652391 RepID=UPI0012992385|nr:pectinesterase family protein [Prolixibacter sp. SD074]
MEVYLNSLVADIMQNEGSVTTAVGELKKYRPAEGYLQPTDPKAEYPAHPHDCQNNARQYFTNCHIEGTTDFIFGSSTAVFNDCDILCKKQSSITAARTPKGQPFGYVFMNCKINADPEISQVYLDRPWRAYAKVVFMNCELGRFINPEGWSNWHDTDRYKTAFYTEFHNTGTGANTTQRVSWPHQLTNKQEQKYTVENILGLNSRKRID